MSDHEVERFPSSFAESRVMEGDLDVGIFVDELNVGVKTPDSASDAASETFEDDVVFSGNLLLLSSKVFKDHLDHGYNGDQE